MLDIALYGRDCAWVVEMAERLLAGRDAPATDPLPRAGIALCGRVLLLRDGSPFPPPSGVAAKCALFGRSGGAIAAG